MKIISYNLNGIRAAMNKNLIGWLSEQNADIVCFQELKAQSDQFEVQVFEDMGYHCFWHPAEKKGYSGVALLSKQKPQRVNVGCGVTDYDSEGRILRADFDGWSQISLYIPSGSMGDERQAFKMKFLDFFYDYIKNLLHEFPRLVISGDYNICHQAIDIHDPVGNANSSGFLPEEREWFGDFLNLGFIDTFRFLHPQTVKYSWWSYRANARPRNLGWRIDYHLASDEMRQRIKKAEIMNDAYHSDHCPVVFEML